MKKIKDNNDKTSQIHFLERLIWLDKYIGLKKWAKIKNNRDLAIGLGLFLFFINLSTMVLLFSNILIPFLIIFLFDLWIILKTWGKQ